MCVCVSLSVVSGSFATPWTVARQAPLSMEFSRQECWSGLPFPSSGDLPDPGIEPGSPALQADSLPSELLGKPSFTGEENEAERWKRTQLCTASPGGHAGSLHAQLPQASVVLPNSDFLVFLEQSVHLQYFFLRVSGKQPIWSLSFCSTLFSIYRHLVLCKCLMGHLVMNRSTLLMFSVLRRVILIIV